MPETTPKDFCKMTVQELAEYSGPVYTARCVFWNPITGQKTPIDLESPTYELRAEGLTKVEGLGLLQSHDSYYQPERRQPGPKWAKAFGGIDGRCGTNPEDVPDEMITAKEFWSNHANRNGG